MGQVEMTHQDDIHVLDPLLNAPCFGCKNKRQRTPQAFQVSALPSRPNDDVVSPQGEPTFGVYRSIRPPGRLIRSSLLHDVPDILSRVAELAAGHTGRQGVVADGDLLVHK